MIAAVPGPTDCVTGVSTVTADPEDGSWAIITASSFDALAELWKKISSHKLDPGMVSMASVFPRSAVVPYNKPVALPVVKRREVTKRRTLLKE